MPSEKCPARKGFLGHFRTHKFEPRFDLKPPTFTPTVKLSPMSDESVTEVIGSFTAKIYVCDVCSYCGETTKPPRS